LGRERGKGKINLAGHPIQSCDRTYCPGRGREGENGNPGREEKKYRKGGLRKGITGATERSFFPQNRVQAAQSEKRKKRLLLGREGEEGQG